MSYSTHQLNEAFMRFFFCLSICLLCLGMQGCGFLDDELSTDEGLFGVGGIGLEGTGSSGCGGAWGTHRGSQAAARTTRTVAGLDSEEIDMEAMNFRSTKAKKKSSPVNRPLRRSHDDRVVLLFVEHENEVDSTLTTFEREGVH